MTAVNAGQGQAVLPRLERPNLLLSARRLPWRPRSMDDYVLLEEDGKP